GDMHHPALSETNGEYDGEYVFVGDKANARVAVVSLKDFATRQIVTTTLIQSDHGAAFVTPNTEYVVETSQYPAPLGGGYAPTARRACSTRLRRSPSNCPRTCRTSPTAASWRATAGCSSTASTASARTAASSRASPRSSPVRRRTTWTTCTASAGARRRSW